MAPKPKPRPDTPVPQVGQWWADNDKRCWVGDKPLRVGQIVDIKRSEAQGMVAVIRWRPSSVVGRTKQSTVQLRRLRPTASGYRFLSKHEPPVEHP